ncbi:hypothetical protein POPTR_001G293150v4 [Populus trichocarpa]|uniref:Coatomer subunit delta n=1 Tax=Populus trichocarpa TaxID=3694 RepID=A0A3N7ECW3_POPTR|nr:hypothetical protein POPTR_001G293150v4 [Populus trichocarpa]
MIDKEADIISHMSCTMLISPGHQPSSATALPEGLGMKHGKAQRTNQFLESLKAEDEMIVEDMQPSMLAQYTSTAQNLTDPVTLTAEKKLNVTLKRDAWWNE